MSAGTAVNRARTESRLQAVSHQPVAKLRPPSQAPPRGGRASPRAAPTNHNPPPPPPPKNAASANPNSPRPAPLSPTARREIGKMLKLTPIQILRGKSNSPPLTPIAPAP